jgi:hypothetical protein
MRIVLALAVFAASASVAAESPRTSKLPRVPLLCTNSGEKVGGLNKICYYSCARSEGAVAVAAYEALPALEAPVAAQPKRPIRAKRKITIVAAAKDKAGDLRLPSASWTGFDTRPMIPVALKQGGSPAVRPTVAGLPFARYLALA